MGLYIPYMGSLSIFNGISGCTRYPLVQRGWKIHRWLDHENEHHAHKISITMFDDRRIISIDHYIHHHSSPLFIMIDHLVLMFLLKHPFSSHRLHLKPCAIVMSKMSNGRPRHLWSWKWKRPLGEIFVKSLGSINWDGIINNGDIVDDYIQDHIWLVVWNMAFMTCQILGRIISTDELIFFRGVETTNQKII